LLDLRIARLKPIQQRHSRGIDVRLFGNVRQHAVTKANDQGRVCVSYRPFAGCLGGDNIDIAVDGQPAVCLASSLALDIRGRPNVNDDVRVRRRRRVDDSRLVGL
jgi:hypothetical protein